MVSSSKNSCDAVVNKNHAASPLQQARQLRLPDREATLRRDPSVRKFWLEHRNLLEQAWQKWHEQATKNGMSLPELLEDELIDESLRRAIAAAWNDPTTEQAVRDLWTEVHPGVYRAQLFRPEHLHKLRAHLFEDTSGIPTRAPYGILHNRGGRMVDERSEGYLAHPVFQSFYRLLIERYARPLAMLLFEDYIQTTEASESFGFSIHYTPDTEQGIRWHSDASAMTFNVNLDSEKTWDGSSLLFGDPATGKETRVDFAPGVAILHRGAVPHTALPITHGERSNLVLWVMGRNGRQSHEPYDCPMHPPDRWKQAIQNEDEAPDMWAPF